MGRIKAKAAGLQRRRRRVRKKVTGHAAAPRMAVYRSLKHIYAQIVDDDTQTTLVAASSLSKEIRDEIASGGNVAAARAVGKLVAQKAREKNIRRVVFDRGGRLYHGRVKALAEAAREAGLEF
jgi:large subunit ribosomal protein L18